MHIYTFRLILTLYFCMVGFAQVQASEPHFPQRIASNELVLNKMGEFRYTYRLILDLYDAALFTEPNANAGDVIQAEVAYRLEFRYLRTIEKSIILKSANAMLKRNLSPEEVQQIHTRVERLNEAYITVHKGDRSSLTYTPSKGTTLRINDSEVATIPGQDFAQLYFRIWLGEKAISEPMKVKLLGKV